MAQRTTYTDPSTGRFVGAGAVAGMESALRSVYEDGELISQQALTFGEVQDEIVGQLQNWQEEESKWGTRWFTDGEPFDLYGLSQTPFPEGATQFRVVFEVDGNPDYKGGHASTDTLMPDQWPPSLDMLRGVSPSGIAHIVFRNK